jgi:hypothetical protein
MTRLARTLLCAAGGLAAGAALAGYRFPGYLHAQVTLDGGTPEERLYVDGRSRQFLALSVTAPRGVNELRASLPGGEIAGWFPPPVRLPGGRAPDFSGGAFRGFTPGRRLTVYASFSGESGPGSIDFMDAASGRLLRSVRIIRGEAHAGHQH